MLITTAFPKEKRYSVNRIPGMIVTNKGTLIIYNEARETVDDWGIMDIYALRSTDNGATFGEKIVLAEGGKKVNTVNNPVMIMGRNDVIHFLYCENYGTKGGKIYYRQSTDDGVTWSEKKDVTYATLPEYRNAFAFGPGHGIQNAYGDLIVPVWFVPKHYGEEENSHHSSEVGTFYSCDNGKTWKMGEILRPGEGVVRPNETEIALCSDGRVYLNARHNTPVRTVSYSATGYSGWETLAVDESLPDSICFGSVASYDCNGKKALIFSNCACTEKPVGAPPTTWPIRKKVTVRVSCDDGVTWSNGICLDEQNGGYVETAIDNQNGYVYVLWERDLGKVVKLARLTFDEID